jgi:nucleoside-diphosphate-sugar epimerase
MARPHATPNDTPNETPNDAPNESDAPLRVAAVAITGAAGFLGAHGVDGFRARGVQVLPLVRASSQADPAGARSVADVLERPEALAGIDVVIHAAAVRHRYGVGAGDYRASNVELALRVMRAAAAAGVRRFVFVSSVGVYGFPDALPIDETFPYAPRTLYSETKVEAETRARGLAAELGIELVIARPTIVYGPADRNGMMDKMAAMVRAGTYRVVGSGGNMLHHTYIDDIVLGLWLAATRREAAGEDFIFAGPETTTLAELSSLVARSVGRRLPAIHVPVRLARAVAQVVGAAAAHKLAFTTREPPINDEKLDVMTLPVAFDIGKARRLLGYAPRVGYEEGVRRTFAVSGIRA